MFRIEFMRIKAESGLKTNLNIKTRFSAKYILYIMSEIPFDRSFCFFRREQNDQCYCGVAVFSYYAAGDKK